MFQQKIILFIDSLGSGGAQRQCVNLANFYSQKNLEVHLVYYHNENYFLEHLDSRVIIHRFKNTSFLKRLFETLKCLIELSPANYIAFLESPAFLITFLRFSGWVKGKVIITERSNMPNKFKGLRSYLLRLFYNYSDILWTNSRENLRLLKEMKIKLPKDQRVIYNLIQSDFEDKILSNKANSKRLLFVGSISRVKNLEFLYRLICQLKDHGLIEGIDLYGEVKEVDYYNELISKGMFQNSSTFRLMGATSDMLEIYDNYNFLILCSHAEGFPNVIVESIFRGCYVLAPNISDINSILPSQYVYEKENLNEAFFKAKQILLDIEKVDIRNKRNREVAINNFGIQHVEKQLMSLI